jgi:uncharacterized membrane protein (DUF2068 family)
VPNILEHTNWVSVVTMDISLIIIKKTARLWRQRIAREGK